MLCYRQRLKLIRIVSCKRQTKRRTIAAPLSPGLSLLHFPTLNLRSWKITRPSSVRKIPTQAIPQKLYFIPRSWLFVAEILPPLAFFSVLTAILPRPGPTGYKNIVPNKHVKQKWRPRTTKFKTFPIGDARFIRSSLLYLCIFASASLTPLRAIKLFHSLGKVKRTKLLNQLF